MHENYLQTMNLGMIGPSLLDLEVRASHHNQSDVHRLHLESTARSGGQSNHGFGLGQVYIRTNRFHIFTVQLISSRD